MNDKRNKLMNTLPYTMLGFVALCLVLSGCDKVVYHPSTLTEKRVAVEEVNFDEAYDVADLDAA